MSESIEILLEIVQPVYIELDTSPVYYVGTAQAGPKGTDGREVELRVLGTILQWRYSGSEDWIGINDLATLTGFETLNSIGDVGSGADQLAFGNHDHEIGNVALFFENKLI